MRGRNLPLRQSGFTLSMAQGFTLLEVMVALAIMGMGLVLIMQLFAGGLRSVKVSEDYTIGVLYARQKMEQAFFAEKPEDAVGSGAIENTQYTWEAEVLPYSLGEEGDDRYAAVVTYLLKVRVKWPGFMQEKAVELTTLRTVPAVNPLAFEERG